MRRSSEQEPGRNVDCTQTEPTRFSQTLDPGHSAGTALTMEKQRVFQRTLRMGGWFIQAEVSLIVLGKFPAVSVLFLSI